MKQLYIVNITKNVNRSSNVCRFVKERNKKKYKQIWIPSISEQNNVENGRKKAKSKFKKFNNKKFNWYFITSILGNFRQRTWRDDCTVLCKVVGLALRLGRPWNDMTQRRTSGRSLAAWRFLVTILAAVSYKVCSSTFFWKINVYNPVQLGSEVKSFYQCSHTIT